MSDTRIAILSAAAELLNSNGLDDITIRNVATASNYGRSTVVHHFGDKEGLLDALHLVALGHFSAVISGSSFIAFTDEARQVIEDLAGLVDDDGTQVPGLAVFPRFRDDYPGFWTILRFRRCPNFSRHDMPQVWDQINVLTNGYIGAPIGPTVDLIVHQLLALHDWIAVASPADALRIAQAQPSLSYWLSILSRD